MTETETARSEVGYVVAEHIATITLDAPERMNTISATMLDELSARLLDADRDRDVRCIVLTGAGRAFCAGLDIALGCDIRVAGESVKLNPGFAKRGILPESGGTWLLPRMVGYAKAAEIAFTGRTLVAAEAFELGLLNHVVADGELQARARALAAEIAANAPLAVRAIKRMMRAAETETFEQNVHHVFLQLLPLFRTADFQEGVAAYMEKRTPDFTGR